MDHHHTGLFSSCHAIAPCIRIVLRSVTTPTLCSQSPHQLDLIFSYYPTDTSYSRTAPALGSDWQDSHKDVNSKDRRTPVDKRGNAHIPVRPHLTSRSHVASKNNLLLLPQNIIRRPSGASFQVFSHLLIFYYTNILYTSTNRYHCTSVSPVTPTACYHRLLYSHTGSRISAQPSTPVSPYHNCIISNSVQSFSSSTISHCLSYCQADICYTSTRHNHCVIVLTITLPARSYRLSYYHRDTSS